MSNKNNELELTVVRESEITPKSYKAIVSLRTGIIPTEHIRSHKGKGGKEFFYVSHIRATEVMNSAFDQDWEMHVVDTQIFDDSSAIARVKTSIRGTDQDGQPFERSVTEVGGFEDLTGKMSKANIVLAAVSRGLLRCMLRLFNYGSQFYDEQEEEITESSAWISLKNYAATLKLPEDMLVGWMKENSVARSELVERFWELWRKTYELAAEHRQDEAEKERAVKAQAELAKKEEAAAKAQAEVLAAREAASNKETPA